MEWIDALNVVLGEIERNLAGEMDAQSLSERIHFSHYTLERAFAMLTGMTLGEYVRGRRLSAAGEELRAGDAKVIDVALKYGYETPESFQKAFARFHGVTPSRAKREGARLRYLSPLRLQVNLTGGKIMDYRIEHMGEFAIIGMERRFRYDDSFEKIPKFWDEYFAEGNGKFIRGELGVCIEEGNPEEFTYLIADIAPADAQVPPGFVRRTIPEHDWARFHVVGALPDSIQSANRQIYSEWLPGNTTYERAANIDVEFYTMGDTARADYVSEIWMPVRRK